MNMEVLILVVVGVIAIFNLSLSLYLIHKVITKKWY
jgi:hypothetical protein